MTWIDWATVACAVSITLLALIPSLVAIRQQLRIRNQLHLLAKSAHDRLKQDLAVPAADPGIEAGDPLYWDPGGNTVSGRRYPGCVTPTPAEPGEVK